MSIDSTVYLGVLVVMMTVGLAVLGYRDDPSASIRETAYRMFVLAFVAAFWPVAVVVCAATTPFWAGVALRQWKLAREYARIRDKTRALEETLAALRTLVAEFNEVSTARTVLNEQIAELEKRT